jgi:hypothetical protein
MGKSNGSLQAPPPQKVKEALHLHIETTILRKFDLISFSFFLVFGNIKSNEFICNQNKKKVT